jgi:hypothetical protein
VYSSKHQLLFVRDNAGVWTYDVAAEKAIGTQPAGNVFADMSLAPDQSVLFVLDCGELGADESKKPTRVHRFDLRARNWEARSAPTGTRRVARRIKAVDISRIILLEHDQWVDATLNRWEADGIVRELARIQMGCEGNIEYDPRTGRLYYGSAEVALGVIVWTVKGDELVMVDVAPAPKDVPGVSGTMVLSRDGSRLYYGTLQVDAARVKDNLGAYPGPIFAASRDLAFGPDGYYSAVSRKHLGAFGFATTRRNEYKALTHPPAITVSPDGLSVWVLDRDKNAARQFALEGEE